MIHHRWGTDNVCIKCGIARIKKQYKIVARTYSKLINGIWEDIPIYRYGTAWWYGTPNEIHPFTVRSIGFKRPECKKP